MFKIPFHFFVHFFISLVCIQFYNWRLKWWRWSLSADILIGIQNQSKWSTQHWGQRKNNGRRAIHSLNSCSSTRRTRCAACYCSCPCPQWEEKFWMTLESMYATFMCAITKTHNLHRSRYKTCAYPDVLYTCISVLWTIAWRKWERNFIGGAAQNVYLSCLIVCNWSHSLRLLISGQTFQNKMMLMMFVFCASHYLNRGLHGKFFY